MWSGTCYAKALKLKVDGYGYGENKIDMEVEESVFVALREDAKDAFVSLVKKEPGQPPRPCPLSMLHTICTYHSVQCATALLQGQTAFLLDLNATIDDNDDDGERTRMTPLHKASIEMASSIVDLFIRYGAPKHLRYCSTPKLIQSHNKLPLQLALDSLSSHVSNLGWTSTESVFFLITWLSLPPLRSGLETVSLLVDDTEEVSVEIINYVRNGKIIELAALLLVAPNKVTSLNLRQYILDEISLLKAAKMSHVLNKGSSQDFDDKHKETLDMRMSQLLLMEVCEGVGDQILEYLKKGQLDVSNEEVVLDIACLLQNAGFSLKFEDYDLSKFERLRSFDLHGKRNKVREALINCLVNKNQVPDPYYTRLKLFHYVKEMVGDNDDRVDEPWFYRFNRTPSIALRRSKSTQIRKLDALWNQGKLFYESPIRMVMETLSYEDNRLTSLVSALKNLRHHQYFVNWSAKRSIFKLVYVLCLPELGNLLKAIKDFAWECEVLRPFTCLCAKDGKLVELGALLMVAHEKLIRTSDDAEELKSDVCMAIRQCLLSEIQSIMDEENRSLGKTNSSHLVVNNKDKDRKEEIFATLLLIDVFEKAGSHIDKYLQNFHLQSWKDISSKVDVAKDVAYLLQQLGFTLSSEDTDLRDMDCFSIKGLEPNLLERLSQIFLEKDDGDISVDSQPCSVSHTKVEDFFVCTKQKEKHGFGEAFGLSAVRSFHTCTRIQNSMAIGTAPGKVKSKIFNPRKISSAKHWATFALAVQRGIKRI